MSLCYHSEHLAWQQRVHQERSRAQNFYHTTGNFYPSASSSSKHPFPNANQDLVPNNYKGLGYNLAYTFGGTKHIKHAVLDSPSRKVENLREQVRASRSIDTPEKSKRPRRILEKYAEELKGKIEEERTKRNMIEKKLKIRS